MGFGFNVSVLWLHTFMSLESYETIQVLLVAIQDMLQALGGFSLILTLTCSAFGMAYFTIAHENFSAIIVGNLHKAVKGESHDTTDTPVGFMMTFVFDIAVVLILMGVMESILVTLYEKSQEDAKMIRCFTQAHQIFAFRVEGGREAQGGEGGRGSGAAAAVVLSQRTADERKKREQRTRRLLFLLRRNYSNFKPLSMWQDLKTRIEPKRCVKACLLVSTDVVWMFVFDCVTGRVQCILCVAMGVGVNRHLNMGVGVNRHLPSNLSASFTFRHPTPPPLLEHRR